MRNSQLNPIEPKLYRCECEWCGKVFTGRSEFCSDKCYNEWDDDRAIPCTGCGEKHDEETCAEAAMNRAEYMVKDR